MFDPTTPVLVVDDMGTMRKLVAKACQGLGFKTITEAEDGLKAWTALTQASPPIGLIISDWNMPNCTGLEFLKKVRADARYANLPFVLVTAEAESGQVIEALQAGVSNYVVKPFTVEILGQKLKEAYKKVSGTK